MLELQALTSVEAAGRREGGDLHAPLLAEHISAEDYMVDAGSFQVELRSPEHIEAGRRVTWRETELIVWSSSGTQIAASFHVDVCKSRVLASMLRLLSKRWIQYSSEVTSCRQSSPGTSEGDGENVVLISFSIHLSLKLTSDNISSDMGRHLKALLMHLDSHSSCNPTIRRHSAQLSRSLEAFRGALSQLDQSDESLNFNVSISQVKCNCYVKDCQWDMLPHSGRNLAPLFRLGSVLLALNNLQHEDVLEEMSNHAKPPLAAQNSSRSTPLDLCDGTKLDLRMYGSDVWKRICVGGLAKHADGSCSFFADDGSVKEQHRLSDLKVVSAAKGAYRPASTDKSIACLKLGALVSVRWKYHLGARVKKLVGENFVCGTIFNIMREKRTACLKYEVRFDSGEADITSLPDSRFECMQDPSPCTLLRDAFVVKMEENHVCVRYASEALTERLSISDVLGGCDSLKMPIHTLPDDVLVALLDHLDPLEELCLAAMTCRSLYNAVQNMIPGLKLTLYGHQRRAVAWMLKRETRPERVANPTVEEFRSNKGQEFYLNTYKGVSLLFEAEREVEEVRGGFLCDEPGMGKTITVLALILKSRCMRGWNHLSAHKAERTDAQSFTASPARLTRSSAQVLSPAVRSVTKIPSRATLIVVPSTLLHHWKFQVSAHTKKGILRLRTVSQSSEILSAEAMAQLDVVLTTFDVLSKQWSLGSPVVGSERWYEKQRVTSLKQGAYVHDYVGIADFQKRIESVRDIDASEFLKVTWRRIILDEGHVMGGTNDTNRAMMCSNIDASCRWICTGTPTPSNPGSELMHLQGLMCFLRSKPLGNPDVWRQQVVLPFESFDCSAWVRLHAMLSRSMFRSLKADMERLGEIPSCRVETTNIRLSPGEQQAYNGLVCIIQRNLVLAECDNNTIDSLLHIDNRKYALEAISNMRKACCVTGQFEIAIVKAHLDEAIEVMRRGHSLKDEGCNCAGRYFDTASSKFVDCNDREGDCPLLQDTLRVVPESRILKVQHAFVPESFSAGQTSLVDQHSCLCDNCSKGSIFPFITPCGHLICLTCVDKAMRVCPICARSYSLGSFADFQPSVEQSNMSWNSSWIDKLSSKVALLLVRLRHFGFLKVHQSKEFWWHNNVLRLAMQTCKHECKSPPQRHPLGKCIVFSNFIEAIDNVANSISEAMDGGGNYMRFTANLKRGMLERNDAIQEFRENPDIQIILIDSAGALGLDLSFVTHVYLLDPIWDKSQEDQVISRAHRLGAKNSITVEKFIASGTVEEVMERWVKEKFNGSKAGKQHVENVRKRVRNEEQRKASEVNKVNWILRNAKLLPDMEDSRMQASSGPSPLRTRPQLVHEAVGEADAEETRNRTREAALAVDFIPCPGFEGSKPGYAFKQGELGLGYYIDLVQMASEPPNRQSKRVRFAEP